MQPTQFLRLEGLAVLVGALVVYFSVGGPLWLLVVLALAPDLSMVAYLAGPRVGSWGYNLVHTYVLPFSLAGVGVLTDTGLAIQIAAVWVGHIGLDRLAGYGLKFESGFKDTHLRIQPVPLTTVDPGE